MRHQTFQNIRLTDQEIKLIIDRLCEEFQGQLLAIYLYGSRAQADKKGGDIDLWITLSHSENFTLKQIRLIKSKLSLSLNEQKVDLKVTPPFEQIMDSTTKAFYNTVKNTMIELWKSIQK